MTWYVGFPDHGRLAVIRTGNTTKEAADEIARGRNSQCYAVVQVSDALVNEPTVMEIVESEIREALKHLIDKTPVRFE